MKNEEKQKQLLIKALCGYFRYGVICSVVHKKYDRLVEEDMRLSGMFEDGNFYFLDEMGSTYSDKYIPYLRPMDSMTEEEKKEFDELCDYCLEQDSVDYNISTLDRSQLIFVIDWLNSHLFDYRGLIEKELALEAPEGMYN